MLSKKKTAKKRLKKRPSTVIKRTSTVFIIETEIDPKDTLFPEKVAEAKKILSNTDFNGYL